MTAVSKAVQDSTDQDACTARLLAAYLHSVADAFEAEEAERALIRPEKQVENKAILDDHRATVRALNRAFHRVDRDEWIILLELIEQIEEQASVRVHPEESDPDAVWSGHAEWVSSKLHEGFAKRAPVCASRVTVEMIRAALHGCYAPAKGSPKWEAVVPIAKALVGETDPATLRKEVGRLLGRKHRLSVRRNGL